MTAAEAASLQATEAMAKALSSTPADDDETPPPSARSVEATERVETAPTAAGEGAVSLDLTETAETAETTPTDPAAAGEGAVSPDVTEAAPSEPEEEPMRTTRRRVRDLAFSGGEAR